MIICRRLTMQVSGLLRALQNETHFYRKNLRHIFSCETFRSITEEDIYIDVAAVTSGFWRYITNCTDAGLFDRTYYFPKGHQ